MQEICSLSFLEEQKENDDTKIEKKLFVQENLGEHWHVRVLQYTHLELNHSASMANNVRGCVAMCRHSYLCCSLPRKSLVKEKKWLSRQSTVSWLTVCLTLPICLNGYSPILVTESQSQLDVSFSQGIIHGTDDLFSILCKTREFFTYFSLHFCDK